MWSQHIDFHGGGDANLRKAKLIFLLAALAAAALFSCAVSESPASSDSGLVSMFREKLTEEAELSSSENTQILPSGIDDDATVYWVKSGSVYHRDPDCAQLRRSSDIMSGTAAHEVDAHLGAGLVHGHGDARQVGVGHGGAKRKKFRLPLLLRKKRR